jgi:hypothetical protein
MLLLSSKPLQLMSDLRVLVLNTATYLAAAIQVRRSLHPLVTMDTIYKQP